MWLRPGSPSRERTDPAQSQGRSCHTRSDSETTRGLEAEPGDSTEVAPGGRTAEGAGGSGGHLGGRWGGHQLPRRGASPQGHPGLSALQSPPAPPALPAGHPLPRSCLPGGCLHPFVRWFSNLITSEDHWRLAPLLPSEVLSPWVWRGPDTQHFPGSRFSGDALPWTAASRGRSSVLPGEGG